MNTVTKFERYTNKTFTGQDLLKNHFVSKNPIIYTDDTSDYSKAKQFHGTCDYVWLVNPVVELPYGFPLWLKPPIKTPNVVYEFPYVHVNSGNVKSWDMVKLVPSSGIVTYVERKGTICGTYDIYNGKKSFDMFYIGSAEDPFFKELSKIYENVVSVDSILDAFKITTTDMFWIIPPGIKILEDFKFDIIPHERAYDYPHVFGNGEVDVHTGIVLMPKTYTPTEKELEYNFYAKKRIIKKIISIPA